MSKTMGLRGKGRNYLRSPRAIMWWNIWYSLLGCTSRSYLLRLWMETDMSGFVRVMEFYMNLIYFPDLESRVI